MKINFLLLLLIAISLQSCMKDNSVTSTFDFSFNSSDLLLQKFENNGDFINGELDKYFIPANELYINIENYLIVDLRSNLEFSQGRIKNSINVLPGNIVEYFKSNTTNTYEKVVLVSSTGQKAAFCLSILKCLGYNNVYSLNFGLSSWNQYFADNWLNALGVNNTYFEATAKAKDPIYGLPQLENIEVPQLPTYIENRAKEILMLNFDENNFQTNNEPLSISWLMADSLYYFLSVNTKGDIISVLRTNVASVICFGNWDQYLINGYGYLTRSHPSYTWLYELFDGKGSNFQSNQHLQSIPLTTRILIYSFNGQRSAMATAYLRMLGYNASSIVFGSCNMQYEDMLKTESIAKFAFTRDNIQNYEYVSD